jgi:hypothetical protein
MQLTDQLRIANKETYQLRIDRLKSANDALNLTNWAKEDKLKVYTLRQCRVCPWF